MDALLLFIVVYLLLLLPLFVFFIVRSSEFVVELCVVSSLAIISLGKSYLAALL